MVGGASQPSSWSHPFVEDEGEMVDEFLLDVCGTGVRDFGIDVPVVNPLLLKPGCVEAGMGFGAVTAGVILMGGVDTGAVSNAPVYLYGFIVSK